MPIINVAVTGKPDAALSAADRRGDHRGHRHPSAQGPDRHRGRGYLSSTRSTGSPAASRWPSRRRTRFWLDIKVVDGTNTKLELEAYLKAIFAAFGRMLGSVHEESYASCTRFPPRPTAMAARRRNSASSAAG